MDITERTIYNPSLILMAYSFEENYYKLLGLDEDEQAPQIILFVIEDKQIKSVKFMSSPLERAVRVSPSVFAFDLKSSIALVCSSENPKKISVLSVLPSTLFLA